MTQRQWLIIGGTVAGAILLIIIAIAIVARGANTQTDDPFALPTVTTSDLSPLNPITVTEGTGYPPPITDPVTPGFPITDTTAPVIPAPGTPQFNNLRFAATSGGELTTAFPAGTQEVWLIWDYSGITPTDQVERYWYLNNEQYVKREGTWDINKYGSTGTVSDVFLFNRAPQIVPGDWRVELWVNGTKVLEGTFTVAGP